jgi:hypothetical protein
MKSKKDKFIMISTPFRSDCFLDKFVEKEEHFMKNFMIINEQKINVNKKDKVEDIEKKIKLAMNEREIQDIIILESDNEDDLRTVKGMFFGIILSLLFWIGIGLLIFFAMC